MASKQITIAELAERTGASQRRLRRITRKLEMGVGRGSRYGLTAAQVKKVREQLS